MRGGGLLAALLLLPAAAQAAMEHVVQVSARTAWQPTAITVQEGDAIRVRQGSWTANPALGMVGADGHAGILAKEGYALAGEAEGVLVARVCDTVFRVGSGVMVPKGLAGPLYLSINDDIAASYGQGFRDNRGRLTVAVRTKGGVSKPSCAQPPAETAPTPGKSSAENLLNEAWRLYTQPSPAR